VEIKKEAEK
jgi:peptidoglycan hydrolase CwlO-like protein